MQVHGGANGRGSKRNERKGGGAWGWVKAVGRVQTLKHQSMMAEKIQRSNRVVSPGACSSAYSVSIQLTSQSWAHQINNMSRRHHHWSFTIRFNATEQKTVQQRWEMLHLTHTHTHTPLIILSLRLCVLADVPSGALGLQALFCLFYKAYSSLSTAAEDNRLSYSFDNYIWQLA